MSINSFEANVLLKSDDNDEISDFPDSQYKESRGHYDGPDENYALERVKQSPLHKLLSNFC